MLSGGEPWAGAGGVPVAVALWGPVRAWRGGRLLALGPPRQRAVLAVLASQANRVVSLGGLVDAVWGVQATASAVNNVHTYVSGLRRALEPGRDRRSPGEVLVSAGSGYLLRLGSEQLDVAVFEALSGRARRLRAGGDLAGAAAAWDDALKLVSGPPLQDVPGPFAVVERARLGELRLVAVEQRAELLLELGRHGELVAELSGLVGDNPLRERLRELLMLALYRGGRQAEALASFTEARTLLVDELGIEPGPELRRLHAQILAADPVLLPPAAAPATDTGPGAIPQPAGVPAGLVVPSQLPTDAADFTGRADELKMLESLAGGESGTVVISAVEGSAGVGKTALAVRFAHRVAGRFGDGQLYVNLRGYATGPAVRPVEALSGFLHGLGVPAGQVPVEVEQAAAMYRSLVAGRRVLVLLDNAHHPDQVRPLLPGSPGCLVLVTSRNQLGGLVARDGARRLNLDVLTPAEAHALLARLLGPERVEAEPEAVAELASLCAYLPLALRIAAANLTGQPGLSVAGYASRLRAGNRLAALEVAGDEQAAVRAAFDLSYEALPDQTRRLFRLLGLVPGPDVTAEAAAALADASAEEAGRLLGRLATAHLVERPAPGRYGFHDLLRLYAGDQCTVEDSRADRQAATGRLFDYYLHTTNAAARQLYPEIVRLPLQPATRPAAGFDDDTQAAAWLDAEVANLAAAVTHAAGHGPRPIAWLLADALRGYFDLRMQTVSWLTVAQAGLAAAEANGQPQAQAAANLSLGGLYVRQSQHQQALDHYTHASALAGRAGWIEGQAAALTNLGVTYTSLGQLTQAADHLGQALALFRQTGRVASQTICLANLGFVHGLLGRLAEAVDYDTRALAGYRQIGSHLEASCLSNLGEHCRLLGRLDQAHDHLTQALAIDREVGSRGHEPLTLRSLADLNCDAGRYTEALTLARAALRLARDIGHRLFEAGALSTLATIEHRLGAHQQAIDHHGQALHLARDSGSRFPEVVALIGLAAVHQHLGQDEEALGCAHDALGIARQGEYRILEGQALTCLAAIHLAHDELQHAIAHAEQALAIHRETGYRLGEARTHVILSHALSRTDHADTASTHWQHALDLFTDIGTPEAAQVRTSSAPTQRGTVNFWV